MNFDDPRRLYFFFDYISHNAYLAWCEIRALATRHRLELEPVPVLFAGLLSHYKQVGPAEVLAKSRWMLWNVLRKAKIHGIALAPPHSHPFNPLVPLRVSCAAAGVIEKDLKSPALALGAAESAARIDLVDRLFRATWAESRAVSESATVRSVLEESGLDADALMLQAQSEPIKQRLRQNTQDAIESGVFGVPAMRVRGELFWGFDDLEYLDMFLRGDDPLHADRQAYQDWFQVKPSAERKR